MLSISNPKNLTLRHTKTGKPVFGQGETNTIYWSTPHRAVQSCTYECISWSRVGLRPQYKQNYIRIHKNPFWILCGSSYGIGCVGQALHNSLLGGMSCVSELKQPRLTLGNRSLIPGDTGNAR